MLWVVLNFFREKQKTRADGAGWRPGVFRADGEKISDSDGGEWSCLLKVVFTQTLSVFQVSLLQHWEKSRTEMLTSILTTSFPFWLKTEAHKTQQRSLCNRIPTQATWRDLAPLLQQAIPLPWCFIPSVARGKRISEGPEMQECVLVHVTMEGFHSPLPQKGPEPLSTRKKHYTKSCSMTLYSGGLWPSGDLWTSGCLETQAAICLRLPSWEAAPVASHIIR